MKKEIVIESVAKQSHVVVSEVAAVATAPSR